MGTDVMTSIDDRNLKCHGIFEYQVKRTASKLACKACWDPSGDFYRFIYIGCVEGIRLRAPLARMPPMTRVTDFDQ